MAIWAIADLHLSFGTPNKSMDVFGERWKNHAERVKQHWSESVGADDLVLIPGDISWAKLLSEAAVDLNWIHQLPGFKLLLKGNHDYWWGSIAKVKQMLPPSMALIQNNAFDWKGVSIGGSRLWDTPEYSYSSHVPAGDAPKGVAITPHQTSQEEAEKIFVRELQRLDMSLREFNPQAATRIAMTHFPPIGPNLEPSRAAQILEKFKVDICVFGHLHNIIPGEIQLGKRNGVQYYLTACDYLDCKPLKILD